MVSIMNTKACRVIIRMWNSPRARPGELMTEQGDQDEDHFAGVHVAEETQRQKSVWRCPDDAEDEIDRASLAPKGRENPCRSRRRPLTLMFIHNMMKNTLIDMAKVRLGIGGRHELEGQMFVAADLLGHDRQEIDGHQVHGVHDKHPDEDGDGEQG